MKKIINQFFMITIILVVCGACSDFLDKQSTAQLSAETFYNSKGDYDQALAACYARLQIPELTWAFPFVECMTDNGYTSRGMFSAQTIAQGPIVPTSSGVNRVYNNQYSSIARCNVFLQRLAPYSGADMDANIKLKYEAEARLLRALAYLELYKYYGEVPLVTEPLTYETQDQPKASMEAIYKQIMDDVDFAIANLPAVAYVNNGGHFVKSAAQVVKARALLYDAYNDDQTAKQDVMTQVKQITGDIIKTGFYSIGKSYRGLFCDDLGEQNNNPEFIFTVNFLAPLNCALAGSYGPFNETLGTADAGGGVNPYRNFVAEYDFVDGTPFSVTNPLYDPDDEYKNRDPRMGKTIFSGILTFEKGFQATPIAAPSFTDFYMWKIISESDAIDPYLPVQNSNWPLMRYAEVLLMYAEATNEVDGPTSEVYDALNQIRSRSDILMPDLPAGYTKDQMKSKIRQERRIELSFEGFRYDDVKRWKIAEERLNMPASEGVIALSFEKKNYHWPIPQAEIDKSNGILIQNPDYK